MPICPYQEQALCTKLITSEGLSEQTITNCGEQRDDRPDSDNEDQVIDCRNRVAWCDLHVYSLHLHLSDSH